MQRPNILILYTDQQRWDTLTANGNPDIHTPNLDRLAATGVNFTHHFVQNPVCMPSRISFMTGKYPSTLRITHMGVPVPENDPHYTVLPQYFSSYGYHTANIGKLHFLPHANRDHTRPHPTYGFHQIESSDEPGIYEEAYRAWVRRKAPDQLDGISPRLAPSARVWNGIMNVHDPVHHNMPTDQADFVGPVPFAADDDLTHTAFVADQTMDYIRQRSTDGPPWLCVAGFYSPHSPWWVPHKYLDLYNPDDLPLPDFPDEVNATRAEQGFTDEHLRLAKQGYYAMISEVDDWVGKILDTLDEQGMTENTIVVFTSDHGERLGDYLGWAKGPPARESVQRVPLIVRFPAGQSADATGENKDTIVEAVDVLPTLLDAAGIQIPPELQGRSLEPALRAQPLTQKPALLEHHGLKNLRTPTHRYILHADGRELLWDITHPHGEYHDLAADPAHTDALNTCRHQLATRLLEIERPLPRTWTY